MIPFFACDRYLNYNNDHLPDSRLYSAYADLGGYLPRLAELFYDLMVYLPVCVPASKMPDSDFAYLSVKESDYVRKHVLIHKKAVHALLSEGAIKPSDVEPVLLFHDNPKGYYIQNSYPLPSPTAEVRNKLNEDYQQFQKILKPERKATEKAALSVLRQVKEENGDRFRKAMPKKQLAALEGTPYQLLSPYYKICDGGILSYEITFLAFDEAVRASQEFAAAIEKEELLPERTRGIVIASCGNGDVVVATKEGAVRRISHETMDVYEAWDTVAQFFYDTITD